MQWHRLDIIYFDHRHFLSFAHFSPILSDAKNGFWLIQKIFPNEKMLKNWNYRCKSWKCSIFFVYLQFSAKPKLGGDQLIATFQHKVDVDIEEKFQSIKQDNDKKRVNFVVSFSKKKIQLFEIWNYYSIISIRYKYLMVEFKNLKIIFEKSANFRVKHLCTMKKWAMRLRIPLKRYNWPNLNRRQIYGISIQTVYLNWRKKPHYMR